MVTTPESHFKEKYVKALIFGALTFLSVTAQSEELTRPLPVIDMHLHADWWGVPNVVESQTGEVGPASEAELINTTMQALETHNVIFAATSAGNLDSILKFRERNRKKILVGAACETGISAEQVRKNLSAFDYDVIGEIGPQYLGLKPSDPKLAACFSVAEELDIPLGYHMGLGPPGAAYNSAPEYRMALSNPLLLEDVLIKHPKLRLYVMHAGWPMLDEMVGLLYAHPQVYVDVGAINWVLPRKEFHRYLQRLVEAGYGKRIMFGSDQMQWPQAIAIGIDAINSADFITKNQKRDILCNNAATFLRLDKAVCE